MVITEEHLALLTLLLWLRLWRLLELQHLSLPLQFILLPFSLSILLPLHISLLPHSLLLQITVVVQFQFQMFSKILLSLLLSLSFPLPFPFSILFLLQPVLHFLLILPLQLLLILSLPTISLSFTRVLSLIKKKNNELLVLKITFFLLPAIYQFYVYSHYYPSPKVVSPTSSLSYHPLDINRPDNSRILAKPCFPRCSYPYHPLKIHF